MRTISVKAQKNEYLVVIENDFSNLSNRIGEVFSGKIAVVYDQNTHALFSKEINKQLENFKSCEIVFPAGEESKSLQSFEKLSV